MMICITCANDTTNPCGQCDPCITIDAHAERVAQGFDPIERDPVRAARLALRLAHAARYDETTSERPDYSKS